MGVRLAGWIDTVLVSLRMVWVGLKRCVVVLCMSGVKGKSRGSEGHEVKMEDDLHPKKVVGNTMENTRMMVENGEL